MTVMEVYEKVVVRIRQMQGYEAMYREKGGLDIMEAESITNTIAELYEVAKDLESTEEINPTKK